MQSSISYLWQGNLSYIAFIISLLFFCFCFSDFFFSSMSCIVQSIRHFIFFFLSKALITKLNTKHKVPKKTPKKWRHTCCRHTSLTSLQVNVTPGHRWCSFLYPFLQNYFVFTYHCLLSVLWASLFTSTPCPPSALFLLSVSLSLSLSLSHSATLRKRLIIPFYRKQWNRCLQCWSFLFLLLLVVRLWRSFKTTPLRELQKLSRWRQMWGGGVGGAKRKSVILARAEGCSLSPGLLAHSGNWFALHLNGFI